MVEFLAGPRPKKPAHIGMLDGRMSGRLQGDTAEYRMWSHRVVALAYAAQGDGLEQPGDIVLGISYVGGRTDVRG